MRNSLTSLQNGTQLQRRLSGSEAGEEPNDFMRTHPLTSDRIARTATLAQNYPNQGKDTPKTIYNAKIDGMIYGDSAKHGFIRGSQFIHPEMRFLFNFPAGYEGTNQPTSIFMKGPNERVGVVTFASAKQAPSAYAYLSKVKDANKIDTPIQTSTVNGFSMARLEAEGTVNNRKATIYLGAVDWPDGGVMVVRFAAASKKTAAQDINSFLNSLKRLSPTEANRYKPYRIDVRTVRQGDTQQSIAQKMPLSKNPLWHLQALNGWTDRTALFVGDQYRTIIE